MSESLPAAYLARRGETAWSLTGQHAGLTDYRSPSTASAQPGSSVSVSRDSGYEHDLSRPVIRLWSDTHHVAA